MVKGEASGSSAHHALNGITSKSAKGSEKEQPLESPTCEPEPRVSRTRQLNDAISNTLKSSAGNTNRTAPTSPFHSLCFFAIAHHHPIIPILLAPRTAEEAVRRVSQHMVQFKSVVGSIIPLTVSV